MNFGNSNSKSKMHLLGKSLFLFCRNGTSQHRWFWRRWRSAYSMFNRNYFVQTMNKLCTDWIGEKLIIKCFSQRRTHRGRRNNSNSDGIKIKFISYPLHFAWRRSTAISFRNRLMFAVRRLTDSEDTTRCGYSSILLIDWPNGCVSCTKINYYYLRHHHNLNIFVSTLFLWALEPRRQIKDGVG